MGGDRAGAVKDRSGFGLKGGAFWGPKWLFFRTARFSEKSHGVQARARFSSSGGSKNGAKMAPKMLRKSSFCEGSLREGLWDPFWRPQDAPQRLPGAPGEPQERPRRPKVSPRRLKMNSRRTKTSPRKAREAPRGSGWRFWSLRTSFLDDFR